MGNGSFVFGMDHHRTRARLAPDAGRTSEGLGRDARRSGGLVFQQSIGSRTFSSGAQIDPALKQQFADSPPESRSMPHIPGRSGNGAW